MRDGHNKDQSSGTGVPAASDDGAGFSDRLQQWYLVFELRTVEHRALDEGAGR